MKKIFLILLFMATAQFAFGQAALNNYKYVIVPKQFDFQKGADSFQINSLTKFLLEKKGFTTIFGDEVYPSELINNQCLALKVILTERSNFKRTKIKISFLNCQNQVVYESGEGMSTLKDFQKSYHEAVRSAFESFANYDYHFEPKSIEKVIVAITEIPKSEIKNEPFVKNEVSVKPVIETQTTANVDVSLKKDELNKRTEINSIKTLVGLYQNKERVFEIAAFQNYYIFSEQIRQGTAIQTKPLGFIYNTSKKGNYLIKTTDTFTAYLLDNGDFVIDEINQEGFVKTNTFQRIKD